MGEQSKKKFIIDFIFIVLWASIIIIGSNFLLKYLLPFCIAVAVASLVQKPALKLSKAIRINKGACAAALSALLYISLAGVMIFFVFKVFSFTGSIVSYVSQLGGTAAEVIQRIEALLGRMLSDASPEIEGALGKILSSVVESVTDKLSAFLSGGAASIVRMAPSFLFSSVVALAATCYIAKDYDGLVLFFKSLIPSKTVKIIGDVRTILKSSVLKILWGYLILMVLTFAQLAVGLLILRVKNWLLIAFTVALIDLLPVLGVGAVLLPWGIANIVMGNSYLGIGLMVLYLVIVVIRNFAEPKIVASKTGINPLFILLTMFLGLRLFGFVGIIILPVTFIVIIKYYKNEMTCESS